MEMNAETPQKEQKSARTERELRQDNCPRVYSYKNYREFLADWAAWKKLNTARFSGAVFARKAGLQSHTLLGMVIRGKRNLGPTALRSFARGLSLSSSESDYFEKLVQFNQSNNSEDKSYYLKQLAKKSRGSIKQELSRLKNYSKYMSEWYVVAIREMLDLEDFKPDAEWISKKLKNKITTKQAAEAWSALKGLGLVQETEPGKFESTHEKFDIDPGGVSFVLRNYHKQVLERVKDAIDQESIDERELSSLTIAVNDEDYEKIKKHINDFRKQLNSILSTDKAKRKRVITFSTQMINLTRRESE